MQTETSTYTIAVYDGGLLTLRNNREDPLVQFEFEEIRAAIDFDKTSAFIDLSHHQRGFMVTHRLSSRCC